jgi:RimJ/RimL family protein N-acetyltransferase
MLAGKLVRLRAIQASDAAGRWRWLNDREVTLYYNHGYPVSRAEQQAWLDEASRQTSPPFIVLAIDMLDERHIGIINLNGISRENRSAELGIIIGEKDCWSRGYGTDAIITLLRFAFDEINLNRVWLDANAENGRAIACYRKCGFVEEARFRQHRYKLGRYSDSLIMGVLADEFRALHGAALTEGGS